MFVLFFIHVSSRQVHLAGMTSHPDARWMMQQARNMALVWAEQPVEPKILLRDHDTKFTQAFDGILRAEGIQVKPVGPLAPNMNAVAERWVQSVKQECLDHFVICGEKHLRHLLTEYLGWYHQCRPHQGLGNKPLQVEAPPARKTPVVVQDVCCAERLGGLLKHYY